VNLSLAGLMEEGGLLYFISFQNELINIVTIFLATFVGATMQSKYFLTFQTIKIIILGLITFAFSAAGGVLFGKLLNKITGGKINPLIGAAGVSAVPMTARVVQIYTKHNILSTKYYFILTSGS
jgi:Na+-transporting methylmalonyl-CoA/oxaloacetate decarboxylase beta subunit